MPNKLFRCFQTLFRCQVVGFSLRPKALGITRVVSLHKINVHLTPSIYVLPTYGYLPTSTYNCRRPKSLYRCQHKCTLKVTTCQYLNPFEEPSKHKFLTSMQIYLTIRDMREHLHNRLNRLLDILLATPALYLVVRAVKVLQG